MFWDNVAGVYDVFVNVINRKTHQKLKEIVSDLLEPDDTVLECACGTGLISRGSLPWKATNSFFLTQGIPM